MTDTAPEQSLAAGQPSAARESYSQRKIREAHARGSDHEVAYWRRIQTIVDHAPPLSAAQSDRLRVLLHYDGQAA